MEEEVRKSRPHREDVAAAADDAVNVAEKKAVDESEPRRSSAA